MSKVTKWQFNELFESRRDKLVNLLLSEIIFLKSHCKYLTSKNEVKCIESALDKLDYLLITLKDKESELNDSDFDKVIMLIYNIFREIAKKLEQ
ncbi:MAG: hypothetical protein ACFFD5_05440 [Candidatus Thorarchaeota archaeon]